MSTTNRQFLVRTGLNLPAGTSTQAPLTLQAGVNLSTAATGSVEWDGYNLFVTENTTNGTYSSNLSSVARRTLAYTDSTMTPLIASYTATGSTQANSTQITTDYAYVTTSTATAAAYNGVILPAPVVGRSVKIVNNTANSIYVWPQPVQALTGGSSSATVTPSIITVASTTGVYPGMTVPTSMTSGTGVFPANTVVVSILSSTTFLVNNAPTTALSSAAFTVGTASGINSASFDLLYTIVPTTSVEFLATTTSRWITSSAASASGSSNGGSGTGTYTAGSLVYSTDALGTFTGLPDIATVGVPLLSQGATLAPAYTALTLSNTSAVTGILGVANGGTGSNGSSLTSAGATYNLVNTTATNINFGNAGTSISIGASSGTTTINNGLSVTGSTTLGPTTITGNLTVTGTQFISNSTNTALNDPIIELDKPTAGWLTNDNGFDIGLKYHYYKAQPNALFVVTNTVGASGTATLTLSDNTLVIPVNTIISVGTTLTGYTGTYIVTASSAGSVSFASGTTSTITTIGTVSIITNVPMATASSSGTTVTITYATTGSQVLIPNSSVITLSGFSNSAYTTNGIAPYLGTATYVVQSSSATTTVGTITVTTTASNIGTTTAATGNINLSDLFAFSGWTNDAQSFEFYSEGYETSSNVFAGQYGTVKAGGFKVFSPSSINATNITGGAALNVVSRTFYDTTSTATQTQTQATVIGVAPQTIAALNTTVTYTNAASLYIANAPTNGTNVTISNAYAIQVASGNTLLGGNLAVNGTALTSTSATFNLLNTGVTTGNVLGAATTYTIGGSSTTSANFVGSTSGSSFIFGGAAATGNILKLAGTTGGTVSVTTDVTTGTANIFASVTGAINMGGSSTTVVIGQSANSTLTIAGTNGAAGTATINTTTGVVTANVFNTIATAGNLFGTATAVNISSGATGTLTFGNAASVGTINKININVGVGTASFDATSTAGTATIFSSPTGLVTLGAGTTTVTIGASAANVTIGNGGNSTLTVSGASTGGATVVASSGVTTANVFNTVTTVGNLFGVATTLSIANAATGAITGSIGTSSTSGSTYTFGGAITTGTNTVKIGSGAAGTVSFDAGNAAATGNLFPTITGTINVGGAGSTTNFGTTAANSIININGSTATSIQGSGASTANVFNTSTTTTGNLFGYSTTIGIAGSVATGTASTLTFGSAVTTGIINTIKINANTGTAALDAPVATATATIFNTVVNTVNYSTSATAVNIGATTGTTTVRTPTTVIGVNTANNTLTINGNGTAGVANVNSNVTTGTVTLFPTTTGTVIIGGTAGTISTGAGVVKLGTVPSQLAVGNEVVTASWVLNNISSRASYSVNTGNATTVQTIDTVTTVPSGSFTVGVAYTISVIGNGGTGTSSTWNAVAGTTGVSYQVGSTFVAATNGGTITGGSAYTGQGAGNTTAAGQAFTWDKYRSAKYKIQATQVGSSSTRTQSSEILVTHDAPILSFTGATASGTAVTVTSASGLYVGMSITIVANAGSDTVNGDAAGVTTISSISGTTVNLANTATITSGTTLKAYLATSYSATISTGLSATTSIPLTSLSSITGAVYPGLNIYVSGTPNTTYLVTAVSSTTITVSPAITAASGTLIGTPNIYLTEYAVLETNGTIGVFTAAAATAAPYNITLTTTPLTTTVNGIALGTLSETVFKIEKEQNEVI